MCALHFCGQFVLLRVIRSRWSALNDWPLLFLLLLKNHSGHMSTEPVDIPPLIRDRPRIRDSSLSE